jgi:hypothetical protein
MRFNILSTTEATPERLAGRPTGDDEIAGSKVTNTLCAFAETREWVSIKARRGNITHSQAASLSCTEARCSNIQSTLNSVRGFDTQKRATT